MSTSNPGAPHAPQSGGPASGAPSTGVRFPLLCVALRRVLAKGYGVAEFKADALAGVLVGVIALPLSMALAIAVGVAPQHGLYTAIVAGAVVALLGGSKFQVTGPTAAFVVILVPVVDRFGLSGLLLAGALSGVMLIVMGLMRFGDLIKFIPYPVTTGFTTGIALVIATLQTKDFFGLEVAAQPAHYLDKLGSFWESRATLDGYETSVGLVTLVLLLGIPKLNYRLPAPLVALTVVTVGSVVLGALLPEFEVATIGSRFSGVSDGEPYVGIPRSLPAPDVPWSRDLSWEEVRLLLPAAFAIAMLGAIESLLSAVIADGLTGTRHDPNSELLALGIGNVLVPIFGGIPATGALARTATNIRAGAVSPIAAVVHSLFVLISIVLLAPLVAHIPMAALAALLLIVAWNMSEVRHFGRLLQVAPNSDRLVLVVCFLLTVVFDMVLAIAVGVVLAALLFMRRMSTLTQAKWVLDSTEEGSNLLLPSGVSLYEVNGPLFFGVAQSALEALRRSQSDRFSVLVLSLAKVPVIDATGFAALESAMSTLARRGKRVILVGPLPQPRSIFNRAELERHQPGLLVENDLDQAIRVAGELAAQPGAPHSEAPPSRRHG